MLTSTPKQTSEQACPRTNLANFLYAAAQEVPDNVCIETDTACYTYAQMVRMTESIRLVLKRALSRCEECQVPPVTAPPHFWERRADEHTVCIVLDRGPECVAAIHATMLERCVYSTFDATEPREKLKCWIEIARHPVMITSRMVMDRLGLTEKGWTFGGEFPKFVLNVHEVLSKGSGRCEQLPAPVHNESDADRLCYVIFTSGSTGKPKAVMIEHRSACNLVRVWSDFVGMRETDRAAQMASMAFDNHVPEIYGTMHKRCTSVVVPDVVKRSGPDMLGWLADKHVNLVVSVPSHLRSMSGPGVDVSTVALPHLRVLDIGGEALGRDVVDTWAPGRVLFNIYGPTEVTVVCCGMRVQPGDEITIGHDLPTYKNKVLNQETLQQCPTGERGVLYTGGIGCARGYLDDREKTTSKFSEIAGLGRMYYSGDVVSTDALDRFHYHGRADWQVKVRGIRIELEALEEAVGNVPGVKHCESRVIDEGRKLVVIVSGPKVIEADVKGAAAKLGKGYVLSQVKVVDQGAWKFNTSGKLVRNVVPLRDGTGEGGAPEAQRDSWEMFRSEEASEMEISIAKCVAQLVDTDKEWSTDSHFIEVLGLDSAGFGKLITLLRRKPSLKSVDLPTLFDNPTVALLSAVVEGDLDEEESGDSDFECEHSRSGHDSPDDLLHTFLAKCVGWPLKSRTSSAATNLLARIAIPPKIIPPANERNVHALCVESKNDGFTYTQMYRLALAAQTLLRRAERAAGSRPEANCIGTVMIALPANEVQIAAMIGSLLERRVFAAAEHDLGIQQLSLRAQMLQASVIFYNPEESANTDLCGLLSGMNVKCGLADPKEVNTILSKPLKARRPALSFASPFCNVVFTAGTTGPLKAATYSHSALTWAARAWRSSLDLGGNDRVAQIFGVSRSERLACTWATFEAGSASLFPPEQKEIGTGLQSWLQHRRVSALGITPTDLAALGPNAETLMDALRVVWVADFKACSKDLAVRWARGRRFIQAFSRPEVPGACTLQITEGAQLDAGLSAMPYGQAMVGCQLHVLNEKTLLPVPQGATGILFVSGPSVSSGYLNALENHGSFVTISGVGTAFCTRDSVRQGIHGLEIVQFDVAKGPVFGSSSRNSLVDMRAASGSVLSLRRRTSYSHVSFRDYLIGRSENEYEEDPFGDDAYLILNLFVQSLYILVALLAQESMHVLASRFLFPWSLEVESLALAIVVVVLAPTLVKVALAIVAVVLKWGLIGSYREGDFSIYSTFYLKHWIVEQVVNKSILGRSKTQGGWNLSVGANFMRILFLKALGAKISFSATVTTQVTGWDLIEVGHLATVHGPHHLTAVTYVGKRMLVGRIRVERGATVCHGSCVGPGSVLRQGTFVECLSTIAPGTTCNGGRWSGVPARQIGGEPVSRTRPRRIVSSKWMGENQRECHEDMETDNSSDSSYSSDRSSCGDTDSTDGKVRPGGSKSHLKLAVAGFLLAVVQVAALPLGMIAAIISLYFSRLVVQKFDDRNWPDRSAESSDDMPVDDDLPPVLSDNLWFYLVLMPLYAILNEVISLLLPILACRLLPRIKPPLDVPVWSCRAWIASTKLFLATKASVNLGDASVQAWYLRLCGATIGKGTSLAEQTLLPDTVEVGHDSFFASGNTLTSVEVDQGRFRIPTVTKIGSGCFLGNENHVAEGIRDHTFVGLRTWLPTTPSEPGSYFGNPSMKFGRVGDAGEEAAGTCLETFWYHFSTSFVDVFFWKVLKSLQLALSFCLGRLAFASYNPAIWCWQFIAECAIFVVIELLCWYLVSIRFCALFYHDQVPLTNRFYSRHVMAWFSANKIRKVFKPPIQVQGTLWAASYMRMFGIMVGKRFFSPNEDCMIDPPFGRVGDDVTIDYDAQVRQHSFEDNMLKWGPNWIGSGTSILQAGMVAMSDCGEGVALMRGAVTWKGQMLEPGTAYDGAPATAVMSTEDLLMSERSKE